MNSVIDQLWGRMCAHAHVRTCASQLITNQQWSLSSYHHLKLDISPSCWQKKIEEWGEKTERDTAISHT